MKSTRLPSISLRAALALIVFVTVMVMVTVSAVAERGLFAMDTGTRDASRKTYAQQAAMGKEPGVTFNLCHWLKVDGKDLETRLMEALPHLFVVTVNGADSDGGDWHAITRVRVSRSGGWSSASISKPCLSCFPVGFSLLMHGKRQYVAC